MSRFIQTRVARACAAGGALSLVSWAAAEAGPIYPVATTGGPCAEQCVPEAPCPPDASDILPGESNVPPEESEAPPTPPLFQDPGASLPPVVPVPNGIESGEAAPVAPTPTTQPAARPSARAFQTAAVSEAGLNELAFSNAGAGYIDVAVVRSMFRVRYDAAFDGDFSIDRAEYLYPAYCTAAALPGPAGGADARADVDYQELHAYLEYAFDERFSTFVNVPFRWVDTTITGAPGIDARSGGGLSDVWFGLKYALVATADNYLTFQTKVYTPTGDKDDALGVNHYSVEPGLLFQSTVTDDLTFFGEAKYWIPIETTFDPPQPGGGASGRYGRGVAQYGLGGALDLYDAPKWKLQQVTEAVGWTAIDSLKGDPTSPTLAADASGDTIVNLKIGGRLYNLDRGRERSSVYAGWGHALTDDKWYEDVFRLEYRVAF